MNYAIPPIPPDAAPWVLIQAIGRETVRSAWAACWEAGHAVGYALGIAHACLAVGALITCSLVIGLVVALARTK